MLKTSGLFTTAQHKIKLKSKSDEHWIAFFSDVHLGHPQFARDEWDEFRDWGRSTPNVSFCGNGDYWESFRAHTRAALLNIPKEERYELDEQPNRRVLEFAREIDFMRNRLIGLGDGNHTWEFVDGHSAEMRLAKAMGCAHLGVSSVVQVQVECYGERATFLFAQHHGKAGATSTPGGPYNTVERWSKNFSGVTIFVMGDDHSRGFIRGKPQLEFFRDQKRKLLIPRAVPRFYCRSGSFKRVYEPGQASYEIDRGYGPTDIGALKFRLRLKRSRRKGLHIDFEGHV